MKPIHQERAEVVCALLGSVSAERLRIAKILNLRWNNGSSKCDCCRSYGRFVVTGTISNTIVLCTNHAQAAFRTVLEDGALVA